MEGWEKKEGAWRECQGNIIGLGKIFLSVINIEEEEEKVSRGKGEREVVSFTTKRILDQIICSRKLYFLKI